MNTDLGDLVFKKEFYSTSNCVLKNGKELRLKNFARSWIEVKKTGDVDNNSSNIFKTCFCRDTMHQSRGKEEKTSPKEKYRGSKE